MHKRALSLTFRLLAHRFPKEIHLAEYKKHVVGEAVKGLTAGLVGALLLLGGQKWFTNDLEFKQASRDAYISAPLGQQGLTMAFDGKPLKNVSIVEFTIFNRTAKQVGNVDLLFTIDDLNSSVTLVSGGIIPPKGMSLAETIEELPSKDLKARKFRIKIVPRQRDSEYFHAVFVFNGDKAPPMSVASGSSEISIAPYQQWKDNAAAIGLFLGFVFLLVLVQVVVSNFVDYFYEPRKHKKKVERFAEHAADLQKQGKLKSTDIESLADAGAIYASFSRPKPSKFWSKVLPDQRFEY